MSRAVEDIMSVRFRFASSAMLVLAFPLLAGAAPSPTSMRRPAYVASGPHLDLNQDNLWVTNIGSFAWDIASGSAGLVYPRGSGHTAVFAAGLWVGGMRSGQTRVTVAEYTQEYGPGPMIGTSPSDPAAPDAKVYKVVRWTGNPQDSAHVDRTPAELTADPQLDGLFHHG